MSGEIQELYFDRLGKTYTRLEYDNITYLMRLSVRCYCHFNQIWHVQFPSQEEFHNMLRILACDQRLRERRGQVLTFRVSTWLDELADLIKIAEDPSMLSDDSLYLQLSFIGEVDLIFVNFNHD
ncbi:hypothetical protein DERP_014646 [Dermatophagoides pteronyssinus]|uniref:Uncharacterized protein n=1 Tax=Dermatophagoides pteronyssinus TaxID=6956 RepID=A0ABQ8IU30_DERPT|nr:hypothetical protein DERP_014646 [Dermatophagoides pteronyssinus]